MIKLKELLNEAPDHDLFKKLNKIDDQIIVHIDKDSVHGYITPYLVKNTIHID